MLNISNLKQLPTQEDMNLWDFSREINALEQFEKKGKKQMAEEKEEKPLSRRERFKKYRDKRLYQAVRAIKLCENMANKNSYDYTEEESSIILKNIREAVNDLQHAFKKGEKKTKFFS
jgi:hypothetical protein